MERILSLMILGVIPQNFDPNNLVLPIQKIEEGNRIQHAKQLLGKDYQSSSAQKAESIEKMEFALAQYIYQNLPSQYRNGTSTLTHTIIEEAQRHNLDPVFVTAIIETESRFQPRARGFHGEMGLMQIKPSIAEWVANHFKIGWTGKHQLENPVYNIKIGTAYFAYLKEKFKRAPTRYIAAYNVGETRLRKLMNEPDSNITFSYTRRALDNYNRIYEVLIVSQIPYFTTPRKVSRQNRPTFHLPIL